MFGLTNQIEDKFVTIYTSVYPVEAYIIKLRLECDGFSVFIFDDQLVWVNPFKSNAIGGVKLKLPVSQIDDFNHYIESQNKADEYQGDFDLSVNRSIREFELKSIIRKNPGILDKQEAIEALKEKFNFPGPNFETLEINEIRFRNQNEKRWKFNWDEFWKALFAPEIDFWKYLRPRGNDHFLEKDEVELFEKINSKPDHNQVCPFCQSENIYHGPKINYHWNIPFLIGSMFISAPAPYLRLDYHCFDCNNEFKIDKEKQAD